PPGALLSARPDLEEPPNGTAPENTLGSGKFYCRSWCPRHPDVHPLIFGLLDELIATFGCDAFHVGMDEVFVLASPHCPRCRGADPAAVYAEEVNALAAHLKKRGQEMLMWADRFLDGKATGYGLWEGSENGTAQAIDLIPKDVVMCDWHYEGGVQGAFPSLEIFRSKGFRVWPTVWKHLEGARTFMRVAAARNDPGVLGTLASVWTPAARIAEALLDGTGNADARATAEAAVTVLREARDADAR
ncbi:MAG: family 20 glycosylhydrolase, partial [bacterium]